LVRLPGSEGAEHHRESGNENVLTVGDTSSFLDLGSCIVEEGKYCILNKLREAEPETDALGFLHSILDRLFNKLVIFFDDEVIMAEACNGPIVENRVSSE
jgi:hypothetical protein